ncbi:MAG: RNA-binding protein [Bacteroidales bacterium]|nr:RNA-binding protein [Bacteroidales bacterium]MBN2818695.1 RNA-binding protein [Bacteroidales bacterium]
MNIFVGNLNFKVSDSELESLFEDYGQVSSAKIITDKYSGRSRGFGFVEMEDSTEAKNAIEGLNGSSFGGRDIVVNEAKPRTS